MNREKKKNQKIYKTKKNKKILFDKKTHISKEKKIEVSNELHKKKNDHKEQREYPRFLVKLDYLALAHNGEFCKPLEGKFGNISFGGAFLQTEELNHSLGIELKIIFKDDDQYFDYNIIAKIVRKEKNGYGIQFVSVDPMWIDQIKKIIKERQEEDLI